jgi:arylsulfatase A-like enzyme
MSLRWLFASFASLLAIAAAVVAVHDAGAPARRNIIFLTVDSFRFDAVSPSLTPCLWAAAESGARFDRHRAVSAWTSPNIVSILTGISSFQQGIYARANSLPETLPDGAVVPLKQLARDGWRVAGTQAFMRIDQYKNLGVEIEDGREPLAWLADRMRRKQPFALWFHYVNVHLPYHPSPAFMPTWETLLPPGDEEAAVRVQAATRLPSLPSDVFKFTGAERPAIRALYEGGVKEFDGWFCGFWSFLERSGALENTMVVVTSDHGEELAERGAVGHASTTRNATLFDEVLRIPLFVWGPGVAPRSVTVPTDHLDIIPTALAFLGEAPSLPLQGRNLLANNLPPKTWQALTSKAGFGEADSSNAREFLAAKIEGNWKAILRLRDDQLVETSLYDLVADPGERHDRSGERSDIVARLVPLLMAATIGRRQPVEPASGEAKSAALSAPRWIFPDQDRVLRHGDLAGGLRLRWSGPGDAAYVLQYRAGEGVLALSGEMEVSGASKDFGIIDRRFWETYIVPYGVVRLRVRPKGAENRWSDWVEVRAAP